MTHSEMLEIGKMMSDLFKLVTTLDTGMIGIIIAVVEKVFTTERVLKSGLNKGLLGASLFFLILSLIFSLVALAVIPNNLVNMLQESSQGTIALWVDTLPYYGSIVSFFLGVFFFVFLAVRSISSGSSSTHQATKQWQRTAMGKVNDCPPVEDSFDDRM